jgi:hypothetical protein
MYHQGYKSMKHRELRRRWTWFFLPTTCPSPCDPPALLSARKYIRLNPCRVSKDVTLQLALLSAGAQRLSTSMWLWIKDICSGVEAQLYCFQERARAKEARLLWQKRLSFLNYLMNLARRHLRCTISSPTLWCGHIINPVGNPSPQPNSAKKFYGTRPKRTVARQFRGRKRTRKSTK